MEREELGPDQIRRTLRRLAHEIVEQTADLGPLALVGVRTRGVHLARRLARDIQALGGSLPPVGALDVTLYRDDLDREASARAKLQKTDLPFSCADREIVLVDDVLYTGRTTRAALAALVSFGRPRRVRLAVMADRGGRELPVRADFVGKNLAVRPGAEVKVLLEEIDGRDALVVRTKGTAAPSRGPAPEDTP
ncbi:MAG: bifunctional pyr operon transcriptional regulator/uracil phosphoribosyltransferase PyrR [Candidatus Tectomicrobia bacterium]|nr:bifunctional pyr operon transcriptional regulator/uracil phosphoribosyltransferase PyrR [Candidatus Tectomicrobia bacterium]